MRAGFLGLQNFTNPDYNKIIVGLIKRFIEGIFRLKAELPQNQEYCFHASTDV
jgi:hypothetical protein